MNILKSTISVGVEKPFVFLHVSDIHLTETDENDSPARRIFAADRKNGFPYARSLTENIKEYVRQTGYHFICGGDLVCSR